MLQTSVTCGFAVAHYDEKESKLLFLNGVTFEADGDLIDVKAWCKVEVSYIKELYICFCFCLFVLTHLKNKQVTKPVHDQVFQVNIRVTSNERRGPPFEDLMVGLFEKTFSCSPITCHDYPRRKFPCASKKIRSSRFRRASTKLNWKPRTGTAMLRRQLPAWPSTRMTAATAWTNWKCSITARSQRNVFSSLTLEWDTSLDTSMIPSIAYNRNAWEGTRKGKDKKNVVAVQTKLILIMNYILNTYFSSFRTIRMLLLLPH